MVLNYILVGCPWRGVRSGPKSLNNLVLVTSINKKRTTTGMKTNASPPTTYVVILLNLRSVAAFTVLAACRVWWPSSIMSATVLLWRRRRRTVLIWRMITITPDGMEIAGSRIFLRYESWPATCLPIATAMETTHTTVQAKRARRRGHPEPVLTNASDS